jgi:glyoxylate/hydroxypyruvate reductase A
MTPSIIAIRHGDAASLAAYRATFAEEAPHIEVRDWNDPALDPRAVTYALVWGRDPERLAAMVNIKALFSPGAGVEHIVSDPAWPAHVPLVRMFTEGFARRMGEYAILGALALMKDLPRNIAGQQAATWDQFDPEPIAPDVRAGIMGMGNLGGATARMMRGFGFPVAGWSATRKSIEGVESFAGMEELPAFLARTDMLVMMLPDTAATKGIMNARTLAMLPKGAGVVNAGRGPQLVLADLIAALDSGHLHGAFLDVFDPEPPPPAHPVWRHKRIIMTPHNAAFDTRRERARYVARAILAFERGEGLPNLYDAARGY